MHIHRFTQTIATLIAIFASGALASQTAQQESTGKITIKPEIVKQSVDLAAFPDVIHPQKYAEVIPLIYTFKPTPQSVVLRIGQEFAISSLRVQAQDKDQNTLGTLTAYNTQLKPGVYKISGPMRITGSAPGVGEFIIAPPFGKALITDRPIPELRIVVTVLE